MVDLQLKNYTGTDNSSSKFEDFSRENQSVNQVYHSSRRHQRGGRAKYESRSRTVRDDLSILDRDSEIKQKVKDYADKRRNVQICDIKIGDKVLVLQKRLNKLSTKFENAFYVVIEKFGSQVIVQNCETGVKYTRNINHVRKYLEENDDLNSEEKEENVKRNQNVNRGDAIHNQNVPCENANRENRNVVCERQSGFNQIRNRNSQNRNSQISQYGNSKQRQLGQSNQQELFARKRIDHKGVINDCSKFENVVDDNVLENPSNVLTDDSNDIDNQNIDIPFDDISTSDSDTEFLNVNKQGNISRGRQKRKTRLPKYLNDYELY
ncbi:hypothetical protein LOTGIDRAFT_162321 [Lottia gigantea]|uniref:Uncharacterized protein n=1 Tax=Lottia gigantea TaxID=225164 RepID=V4ACP3_LOTGI|nr:hypothetical protein LOTGIDRAFT_162321 [Lottia gigantea]ESO92845.1 hypothetical protein LOTGIDRAFT_162321 [Lottia gigantea]